MQSLKVEIDFPGINNHLLNFLLHFHYGCLLSSNDYKPAIPGWENKENSYDVIAACSMKGLEVANEQGALKTLQEFRKANTEWLFGHINYDIKNDIENLNSKNQDGLQFPALSFFTPDFLFLIKGKILEVVTYDGTAPEQIWSNIKNIGAPELFETNFKKPLQQRISREEYLQGVRHLQKHINRGDIYEVNYCMEFYAQEAVIDPARLYMDLMKVSPAPFSAFYKVKQKYLISSSPERYIKKTGNKLVSQPIKGTIKRGKSPEEDKALMQQLKNDLKEQNENVMIVDLVRNDLARIAKEKTVKVNELFGIYSFEQVHQMISTIEAELRPEMDFTEIIRNTFPMGSMTGAPKIKAMELIEQYEKTKRGMYSGTIGYITPNDDFDFNVVIRSILYDMQNEYLSFSVGSAITANAVAEKEYEECLLKGMAMKRVLQSLAL